MGILVSTNANTGLVGTAHSLLFFRIKGVRRAQKVFLGESRSTNSFLALLVWYLARSFCFYVIKDDSFRPARLQWAL